MTLTQRMILLLLLGLTVTSVSSLCILRDMTRCVCNVMVIQNPEGLMNCLTASELELRDGTLDENLSETDIGLDFGLFFLQIDKLIFNNITVPFSFINAVIPFLSLSPLSKVDIISSTLEGVQPPRPVVFQDHSSLKELRMEDLTVASALLHPFFQGLHDWLFGSLNSLALVRYGLTEIDCNWARRAENLARLDLSENPLSFSSLQKITHCPLLSFKNLNSLHLRRCSLTSLQPLCTLLSLTPALTQLDVSGNNFAIVHYPHCPQVTPLRMLNLSRSGITEVRSLLFASLEELDLSYNPLEVFNNPPQTLEKLHVSNDSLVYLPSLQNHTQLQELKVNSSQLTIFINETGVTLSTLVQLEIPDAKNQCHCVLKETIMFNTDDVSEEGEFLCASPVLQQGTQIMNLSLETCVELSSGTQHHHGPPLCLMLFMALLSRLI